MRILAIALNPTIDISSDVETIRPTHKMRTFNQRRHAGGGGVNVARVVVELGGRPELLIFSGGATGALLEDALADLPIDLEVIRIEEPTRIAFMVHERQKNQEYRFVPEGPEVSAAEIDAAVAGVARFDGDFVVASGSLPRGAPDDTYARMAIAANARGQKFVLDSSGDALLRTLEQSHVFLFKPSIGELEKLVGRPLEGEAIDRAAMQFVTSGQADHVAVTLGHNGALLASKDGVTRLPAKKVTVRSAVGAGDSFVGALIWYLGEGHPMADAFRFGVAAGAAAVLTPGTELCHRDDIYRIFASPDGAG